MNFVEALPLLFAGRVLQRDSTKAVITYFNNTLRDGAGQIKYQLTPADLLATDWYPIQPAAEENTFKYEPSVHGRVKLKNGAFVMTPVPLRNNEQNLTALQIANMRTNCCVDALGRWELTENGVTTPYPCAFAGFGEEGSVEPLVSWKEASRQEFVEQPDGTLRQTDCGPFDEDTYRVRCTSYAEAEKIMDGVLERMSHNVKR